MPKSGDKLPNVPIKAHIWQLIAIFPVSSLHCCSLENLYTKTLFNLRNCLEREVLGFGSIRKMIVVSTRMTK